MADQVDIKISEGLVKGIIESKIQTAIVESLSDESTLIEKVVTAALQTKVDESGKRSKYDSENNFTFLEALCRTTLQDAAKLAIQQWANERKDILQAEFLKQLQTKKTSLLMVRACVDGLVSATSHGWTFRVMINK